MNDPLPASSTAQDSPANPPKPNLLRIVLFSILGVMVLAAAYEYGIVRRSYKSAEKSIDDMIEKLGMAEAGKAPTPQDVQTAIGKKPVAGTEDKGEYFQEHYQWRSWRPWLTYDIYVVYDHSDPPQLYNTTRPEPPTSGDVPGKPVVVDLSNYPAADGPGPGVPGGPPAGGYYGPGGAGRPGGGRPGRPGSEEDAQANRPPLEPDADAKESDSEANAPTATVDAPASKTPDPAATGDEPSPASTDSPASKPPADDSKGDAPKEGSAQEEGPENSAQPNP